jgi:hypothetical protein
MKKITVILLSMISANAMAMDGVTIIHEEHVRTRGVTDVPPVIYTIRTLSEAELKFGGHLGVDKVYAKTKNAAGNVNRATPVWTSQSMCVSNRTSQALQYGYRFDLIVGRDNALDAQTFVLQPGKQYCQERTGYVNFTMGSPGNYAITAITRAAEGGGIKEANDKAVLAVH